MADINQVITLGIGTPSDIEHFILVGLNATGPVDIVLTPLQGRVTIEPYLEGRTDVEAYLEGRATVEV